MSDYILIDTLLNKRYILGGRAQDQQDSFSFFYSDNWTGSIHISQILDSSRYMILYSPKKYILSKEDVDILWRSLQ